MEEQVKIRSEGDASQLPGARLAFQIKKHQVIEVTLRRRHCITIKRLRPIDIGKVLPTLANGPMHETWHLSIGIAWMRRMIHLCPLRGCILADDMGIGKSCKTFSLIQISFELRKSEVEDEPVVQSVPWESTSSVCLHRAMDFEINMSNRVTRSR